MRNKEEWWETAVRKIKEQEDLEGANVKRLTEHAYLLHGAIRHIQNLLYFQDKNLDWTDVWENAAGFLKNLKENGLIND